MSKWKPSIEEPDPCRLYLTLAYDDPAYYFRVKKDLESRWGAVDFETEAGASQGWQPLYGGVARRLVRFLSFGRPIGREELVDIRKRTLSLETKYQFEGRPLVELDPGYVTKYSVVRTSLFENFHTVYLYHGIFAESLLYYEKMSFRPWNHTPEFFQHEDVVTVFNDLRVIFTA